MEVKDNHEYSDRFSQTIRPKIKIPTFPKDVSEISNFQAAVMNKCFIHNSEVVFEKESSFEEILHQGFFLVKIPDDLNLDGADSFVRNFYKEKAGGDDDCYRGYKNVSLDADYQGYFDRENDQWENYYIESSNWNKFLPDNVTQAGFRMVDIGVNLLRYIFLKLNLPKEEWSKISGGLTSGGGHRMLAFNHFRPEKNIRGTKLHRDSGWVTVLRSTEPGLVALLDDKLYAINPEPGYFIVNFGSSLEVLTQNLDNSARANVHGVVKTLKKSSGDRVSYVVFLDSDLSGYLYQYKSGKAIPIQTMKEFAYQEVSRTYDDGVYV